MQIIIEVISSYNLEFTSLMANFISTSTCHKTAICLRSFFLLTFSERPTLPFFLRKDQNDKGLVIDRIHGDSILAESKSSKTRVAKSDENLV